MCIICLKRLHAKSVFLTCPKEKASVRPTPIRNTPKTCHNHVQNISETHPMTRPHHVQHVLKYQYVFLSSGCFDVAPCSLVPHLFVFLCPDWHYVYDQQDSNHNSLKAGKKWCDYIVDGAGVLSTNGCYLLNGTFKGKPKYSQVSGNAIIYWSVGWKINYRDDTTGWYQRHVDLRRLMAQLICPIHDCSNLRLYETNIFLY